MKTQLSFWLSLIFAMAMIVPMAQADAAKGAELYKTKCASCHGADGKGDTTVGKALKVRDLAGPETQNLHDSELKTLLENGKGKMPAFKGKLTNQQIEDLVQHLRLLKKK
jgi:mono/diheme cytochrome c family protein